MKQSNLFTAHTSFGKVFSHHGQTLSCLVWWVFMPHLAIDKVIYTLSRFLCSFKPRKRNRLGFFHITAIITHMGYGSCSKYIFSTSAMAERFGTLVLNKRCLRCKDAERFSWCVTEILYSSSLVHGSFKWFAFDTLGYQDDVNWSFHLVPRAQS